VYKQLPEDDIPDEIVQAIAKGNEISDDLWHLVSLEGD
jgi:hypothetical protein